MWKYVSRRLKETIDRANNILDVHRTWSYTPTTLNSTDTSSSGGGGLAGGGGGCNSSVQQNIKSTCLISRKFARGLWFDNTPNADDHSGGSKGQKKKYADDDFKAHDNLLSAITWSGAIVCGWYASQLLCLHRRHLGWDNNRCNRYIKILNVPSKALHLNAYSHFVFAAPKTPSLHTPGALTNAQQSFGDCVDGKFAKPVYEINNEPNTPPKNKPKTKQTVAESVADLVQFLGDTEFQLATQNLAAGRYRSAVKHLKAASNHHHPGATFNLGLCYERGLGVTKNLEHAMECYQLASSMGHSKAIYNLGVYYARGLGGLERDLKTARKCFITAAKLGQSEAKLALGLKGDDIVQDDYTDTVQAGQFNVSTKLEKHASRAA